MLDFLHSWYLIIESRYTLVFSIIVFGNIYVVEYFSQILCNNVCFIMPPPP